ncbi:hypothetical protein [Rahnella contaminans]|uniref:hypothetical protein n=1 Tax=Rahnella contaminans TaxID=2703882 RepID=UPI003C2C720F
MSTNNFKLFAISSGANVLSQADYEALSALASGFQAGKSSSAQINKAIRQATVMAYVLAQFISDTSSTDVLDNGVPATIVTNLKSGLLSAAPGRLLNIQVFSTSGTWTKTSGAKKAQIKCWGGGGGGGNTTTTASGGGAGGGGAGGKKPTSTQYFASGAGANGYIIIMEYA